MTPRKKRSGHKTAASKSGDGAAARQAPQPPAASRPPAAEGGVDPSESATGDAAGVAPPVETAEQAVTRLQDQLSTLQDRHLRTAAEYENFRKRTAKERTETWKRAQADLVSSILDALDDFQRVMDLDRSTTSAEDVIAGVELVERKLFRELESAGLERVGQQGEPFDPNLHEAVGAIPAEAEEQDHTVGAVLQAGYRFGGTLVRPARVQVFMWQGDGSQGPT